MHFTSSSFLYPMSLSFQNYSKSSEERDLGFWSSLVCFGNAEMILVKYLLLFAKQLMIKLLKDRNNSIMPTICTLAKCFWVFHLLVRNLGFFSNVTEKKFVQRCVWGGGGVGSRRQDLTVHIFWEFISFPGKSILSRISTVIEPNSRKFHCKGLKIILWD